MYLIYLFNFLRTLFLKLKQSGNMTDLTAQLAVALPSSALKVVASIPIQVCVINIDACSVCKQKLYQLSLLCLGLDGTLWKCLLIFILRYITWTHKPGYFFDKLRVLQYYILTVWWLCVVAVWEPPPKTRVCPCFTATKPILQEHKEPFSLQFKQMPLKTGKNFFTVVVFLSKLFPLLRSIASS